MRKLPALIAAAGLIAVSLTACSTSQASACTGGAPSGDASKAVKVSGEFGAVPKVDFPTPLKADETQSTVITHGTGPGIIKGQMVTVDLSVYNGTTGKLIEKTEYSKDEKSPLSLVVSGKQVQPGLVKALTCATKNSRVTAVVPPKDAFGDAGNPDIGIGKTDNLVFVIDVDRTFLTRANGADQAPKAGMPTVTLNGSGRPGVTIPDSKAPTDLQIATLKKGDGATVKKGDTVVVHYLGVVWDSKEVFDSSWARGAPASLVAASGANVQGGVIEGFADALVGAKVGSQVIAVIPPDKGYGDTAQSSIPANSTLVFVVDVLGIQ